MYRTERTDHGSGSLLYDGDRVIAVFPHDPEAARHVAELLNREEADREADAFNSPPLDGGVWPNRGRVENPLHRGG